LAIDTNTTINKNKGLGGFNFVQWTPFL